MQLGQIHPAIKCRFLGVVPRCGIDLTRPDRFQDEVVGELLCLVLAHDITQGRQSWYLSSTAPSSAKESGILDSPHHTVTPVPIKQEPSTKHACDD